MSFESYFKCACEELPENIVVYSNPVDEKWCGDYTLVVASRGYKDNWDVQFKAMYIKRTKYGYSTNKPIIEAGGPTIEKALGNLWYTYAEMQARGQIEGHKYYKHYYNEKVL